MAVTAGLAQTTRLAPANETTRILCSATLVNVSFAALVFQTLCARRLRSMAPSPGVDLVALARHAAWAVRQHRRLHAVRTAILIGLLASLAAAATLTPPGPVAWTVVALFLLAGDRAWSTVRAVDAARAATGLVDGDTVGGLGTELLSQAQEDRLRVVNDANVCVYAVDLDADPFPGVGQRVDANVSRTFDISKVKDSSCPIQSFAISDLLHHLAVELPGHIGVTRVDDAVRARMVLYVRGTSVSEAPLLLPDPEGPPVSRAPSPLLKDTADHPVAEARTYLRAQVVGHGGRVVTTLHVTAVKSPLGLSLDFVLHVLRPIHPAFHVADRLPREGHRLAWRMATSGGPSPGNLLRSPGEAWRAHRLLRDAESPPRLTRAQRKAVGAQDFYGTYAGIREATSLLTNLGFNERNDVDRQFNWLVTAIMKELVEFLEAHNIATDDLRDERNNIVQLFTTEITNTINGSYHAGIQANGNITIGGNVQANQTSLPNLPQDGTAI